MLTTTLGDVLQRVGEIIDSHGGHANDWRQADFGSTELFDKYVEQSEAALILGLENSATIINAAVTFGMVIERMRAEGELD